MTPTITQMQPCEQPPMYSLIVRTFKRGLAGVPTFEDATIIPQSYSRERILEAAKIYLNDNSRQVRVEGFGRIMAVGLHGSLLWLEQVPPPKYWLDYRRRPEPKPPIVLGERMAPCGLPIPERYLTVPKSVV